MRIYFCVLCALAVGLLAYWLEGRLEDYGWSDWLTERFIPLVGFPASILAYHLASRICCLPPVAKRQTFSTFCGALAFGIGIVMSSSEGLRFPMGLIASVFLITPLVLAYAYDRSGELEQVHPTTTARHDPESPRT